MQIKKIILVVPRSKTGQNGDNEILIAPIIPDKLASLSFQRVEINTPIQGRVNSLWKGKKNLWIGTWEDGVAGLPEDTQSGMIAPGPLRILRHDPENPNTISSNATSGIWEDPAENLWVGTYGKGLNKVALNIPYGNDESVVRYKHNDKDTNSLRNNVIWWDLYPEDEKSFWVIAAYGIDLFRNDRFEHAFVNEYPMTIRKTSQGKLFIGAIDGLYESEKNENHYTFKRDPLNYPACDFQDDRQGRIWISTCEKTDML